MPIPFQERARQLLLVPIIGTLYCSSAIAQSESTIVDDADISVTILATNLGDFASSDAGPLTPQGEFSFGAFVEVGDKAILFDTGWTPRNVLENA